MLGLYRDGRQAEALNAFQRAREILADELGIDPSPELLRLHERILKQDPGLELRGEPLRGYRLLEKVDDGPTGIVFRAIQPHVERDVAVKMFHEGIAADPEFVRRFDPDAQAIAALEHPHIAPIYDYWREPGRAYIVSRYLRGGSLRAIEERGEPLERDRAPSRCRTGLFGARVRPPTGGRARERRIAQCPLRRGRERLSRGLPDQGRPAARPLGGCPGARPLRRALAAERVLVRASSPRALSTGRVHPMRMRSP